jgi:hypothetical protein
LVLIPLGRGKLIAPIPNCGSRAAYSCPSCTATCSARAFLAAMLYDTTGLASRVVEFRRPGLVEIRKAMTDLLYLDDAYLRVFDAEVVAVDSDAHAVALHATAFFPNGGGQPRDSGDLASRQRAAETWRLAKFLDCELST